jgi:uncharacterized protein (UPF0248 family)
MVTDVRSAYNAGFSEEIYQRFLKDIHDTYDHVPPFRIAETPVFVGKEFKKKLYEACSEIAEVICRPDYKEISQGALSEEFTVPNEDDHTLFLQMDFGVCQEPDGTLMPKLIEVQGFPSLYFYQDLCARAYRKHFPIPDHYNHLFDGLDSEEYLDILKKAILRDEKPENVILLEIEPQFQVTEIDFRAASAMTGMKTLCLSDLKVDGRDVYYIENGRKIPVHRIYNRVIFDELVGRKDLPRQFQFMNEYNIEWAGHPNWFFRISKYTLPFLDSQYVPKTWFLDKLDAYPEDLTKYVLKPLFSFSGSGVIFNVTKAHLDNIEDRKKFILQEKVAYSPVIKTLDIPSKCEIRMLMVWDKGDEKPRNINNLARLSKGEMIGVRFNKDKTWVGGSVAYFEED